MWRAITRQPDAAALALLVLMVTGTLLLGVILGYLRDQRVRRNQRQQLQQRGDETPAETPSIHTWPALIKKELLAALVTLLLITWWAMARPLELGPPADPTLTPAVAKAPWFFIGVQEMLQYFDAWLAGSLLPLLMIIGLAALPYLDLTKSAGDYSLRGRPLALGLTLILALLVLLPMVIGLFFRSEHWIFHPSWLPPPVELPPTRPLTSLADLLGLGRIGGQLLGGAICLGPLALLPLIWRLVRSRPWAHSMGCARFLLGSSLIIGLAMVVLKVSLVVALDVRYLWVTPWVRI